jgi:hypothetical protein
MIAIIEKTCERAWLRASEHLASADGYVDYNMIIEIAKPTLHEASDRRARTVVDEFFKKHEANRVGTVADTIFPSAQYVDHGARGVYEVYPDEIYPEILGPHEWGRYANRLVRWPPAADKASAINPLRQMVEKIKTQIGSGSPAKRACYEISLTDSAIDLPLYDPTTDAGDIMGGPCLSHVSFKLGPNSTLNLTALYRSHYYVARALGNFLGLAALQAFVCNETQLAPGPLVCVSSYAKLDTLGKKGGAGWGISEAKALVASARAAFDGVSGAI